MLQILHRQPLLNRAAYINLVVEHMRPVQHLVFLRRVQPGMADHDPVLFPRRGVVRRFSGLQGTLQIDEKLGLSLQRWRSHIVHVALALQRKFPTVEGVRGGRRQQEIEHTALRHSPH